MKAKEETPSTAGDFTLNAASIVLAFFSATFAGYMVMYGPTKGDQKVPEFTVALEPFEATHEKLGNFDNLDPIVTGSIAKTSGGGKEGARTAFSPLSPEQHLRYNLRNIFQDTAFVDISNGRSVVTLPVERGAKLPGVGEVLRFEKRQGKWILITSGAEISEEGTVTLQLPN